MNMQQLVKRALSGRVGLYAPQEAAGGDRLYRVEDGAEVDIETQRDLWKAKARFYVLGGTVEVHKVWKVTRMPVTPEAEQIEKVLGMPVTALYERYEE
jgi:hypothetical protein